MSWVSKCIYIKEEVLRALVRIDAFFVNPKIKRICFTGIVLLSFVFIYILNFLHPLFGDDWFYSMLPNSTQRIQNFAQILTTQYEHYFTWGGRTIVHIIAQTLLLLGPLVADILNSSAYVCLTLVIYKMANQSNQIRPSLLIVINFVFWFFQPAFGSTILWITGSANYLWGSLIIVCFMMPYVRFIFTTNTRKKEHINYKDILLFLFGIIAGWTNENMAVSLISMLVIFILYYQFVIKQIPFWSLLGLLGAVIGCVLMISAPGNYVRMSAIMTRAGNDDSFMLMYLYRLVEAIKGYYYYSLVPTFIYLILLIFHRFYGLKNAGRLFVSLLFVGGALVADLAMSGSPIFPGRAAFGINVLLFIAISILFSDLDFSKSILRSLVYVVILFATLQFLSVYTQAYKTLSNVYHHAQSRLRIIENGKSEGKYEFILDDRISPASAYLHYFELTPDSTDWHNRMYSSYYGINSIIVK